MKINISINNTYIFGLIARLVDQDEFIKDIQNLRKKYKVKVDNELDNEYDSGMWLEDTKISNGLGEDIPKLFYKKYKVQFETYSIILEAIYKNNITEREAHNIVSDFLEIEGDDFDFFKDLYPQGMKVIILNQNTKKEDVLKAFDYFRNIYKKDFDIRPEIRDHREWYWEHKSKYKGGKGMSYKKIAEKHFGKLNALYSEVEKVRKAIKSYEKMLIIERRKLHLI